MRINTNQKFQFFQTTFIILALFLPACGSSQMNKVATETQVEETTFSTHKPTSSITTTPSPSPTSTPHPTQTSTIEPYIEDVTVPECVKGGATNDKVFSEVMDSLFPHVLEMESFHYHTIYRYKENGNYPDDELSIELIGIHSGLLSEPGGGVLYFYPLTSQRYERSHIIQTDLRTGSKTETIITEQGLWVREVNDKGWSYYEQIKQGEILNFAEMLSPELIFFMLTGSGSLLPGIRTEAPLSVQTEIIDGEEVLHYCWVTPSFIEGIAGYLIHYESIYTFLEEVEVHLWTGAEDIKLVRLAVTGKHNSERLAEEKFLDHDSDRDFLLWMEIYDVEKLVEINTPPESDISLTIPKSKTPPTQILDVPHNEFPLPKDAELSEMGIFREEGSAIPIPREYLWPHYESSNNALEAFAGSNWYDIPDDRLLGYQTNLNRSNVIAFYLEEMEKRGWKLDDVFYQLGWSRLFLNFGRDQVSLLVILKEDEADVMNISAVVPPGEEILTSLIDGWKTYSKANSGLLSDEVRTIAHDGQGEVWIGSETIDKEWISSSDGTTRESPEVEGGISIYDGKSWTILTTTNSELDSNDVWAIEFDRNGQAWISTRDGLNKFDGETWTTYNEDDYQMGFIQDIKIDDDGNVWISGGELITANEISVFDGRQWKTIKHLYSILAFDIDQQGRVWIGTNGGGIYSQDGENWIEHLVPKGEPNNFGGYDIEDMSFDTGGNLWIINGYQGVSVFDGESWTNFDPENTGLSIDYVQKLEIDQYDRLWLVTIGGSVFMRNTNGEWSDFTPDPIGISIDYPRTLDVDQEGRIWVGSSSGVAVFTPPEP